MLIVAAVAFALPSSASAASCPVTPGVFATAWIGGNGSLHDDANWTNGTPSGSCDVSITSPGSPVVSMTGGANAKSFTLGGTGSTPQLIISDQSPNTNLDAQPAGITIAAGATVTLTCQPDGCPGGGPDIYSGPSPFANAGTITVDSNTGGGSVVGGIINNTGTLKFEKSASLSGKVTNKGVLTIADGATVTNQGSSCGDTGASVKNDTGGTISGVGTGVLSVRNFEQGDGITEDVTIPCGGTLGYIGSGASEIRATGGFNLTGEMQPNQSLTVSAEGSNTNAALQSNFTNKGSITLTCPASPGNCSGGSGGGAGFNVNGKQFVNAGFFTVAADSGTGAGLDSGSGGTVTNTGTMNFLQSGFLRGVTVNQGKLNIADGKTATSPSESCGNTGPRVINDTGGSINATGTGFLSVINYEQGNGTTTGTLPVQIPCGSLKYTGNGASTVLANAGMTGNIAAGQTLRIAGGITSGAFTNAGTIILDQSGSNPTLNTGTLTNTGKIEVVGPSANTASISGGQLEQTGAGAEVVVPAGTKLNPGAPIALKAGTLRGAGTIAGSVVNSGGVVKPGSSPGTLTLTGSYVQEAGGKLEVEIGGTGAGQFDILAVGGTATVNGTLALTLINGFADTAAIGDSVAFLPYGTLAGGFATTTVTPALACPKTITVGDDAGTKALKATVTSTGSSCGGSPATQPPVVTGPTTPPPAKKTCPKSKRLKKGRCVPKKCPKGKKLKKGRCVKKKQPKARSRRR